MPTVVPAALTTEQSDFFGRQGYLVIDDLLSDDDLNPVIDELSAEVDRRARELVAAGELSRTYDEFDFEHRLARISRETDKLVNSIWHGSLSGPAIFDLIRNPKLLDIAESLCGPELIASSVYRVRPKVAGNIQSAVPWHQDSGYFESACDKSLVLTFWLPLVDANEANGCMWVLPHSHDGRVVRHCKRGDKPYLEIRPGDLPPGRPLCVPVPRGGVLLLTNITPHASFDNNTDIVRWSMDLRYQSAALPTNAAMTRLPGEASRRTDPDVPLACYPPEADFLVRSPSRPHEVIKDAAAFHRLRATHQAGPVPQRWTA